MSGSGISRGCWAICKSAPRSRQITTPVPHHSVFYRPDALPAAQPTASKHWGLYYCTLNQSITVNDRCDTSVIPAYLNCLIFKFCCSLRHHFWNVEDSFDSQTTYSVFGECHAVYCCCLVHDSCCGAWYCTDCNGRRHWHRHVIQNIWSPGESHYFQNYYLIIVQHSSE